MDWDLGMFQTMECSMTELERIGVSAPIAARIADHHADRREVQGEPELSDRRRQPIFQMLAQTIIARLGLGMIRKAKAVWVGTGRAGYGDLTTDSGVLKRTPYSFRTRFETEMGTNPEELIAAAHAGCFTMMLAFLMQSVGYTPTELNTEADVTLDQEGYGFRITRSALTLRATVPNISQATFEQLAKDAESGCPVSKVLRAEITLDAKLLWPNDQRPGKTNVET